MYVAEIKWRVPPLLWISLALSACILVFVDVFQYETYHLAPISLPQPRTPKFSDDVGMKGFLVKTPGCKIPDMNQTDPSIEKYLFREEQVVCNNGIPPLIGSNITALYLIHDSFFAYKIRNASYLKCCYVSFRRVDPQYNKKDDAVIFNKKCVEFDDDVKVNDEFVMVNCFYNGRGKIYKDFFAFVPVKSLKNNNKNTINIKNKPPLNVLIIGIDAVSRLNFHRQMPKTFSVLNKLKAVELLGYNKVGDNTFPNLIPVLTGLSEDELRRSCWKRSASYFDDCPFIWKDFQKKNFATAFAEDASWMGIFNYQKRGFARQPTDYYWGTFNREAEKQIGNQHRLNVFQCIGAREVYTVMLQHIENFAKVMWSNNLPYFGFFWGSSLSHDILNKPQLGDDNYKNLIMLLNDEGILNRTALIIMSDHGIRWGGIRSTFQGRLEERLPFVFIYLPQWYRDEFSTAHSNLVRNSKRLTTPYDLHGTLKDLVDPYKLTREFLLQRASHQSGYYSFFDSIPEDRTCDNASISPHWCTCQKSIPIDVADSIVLEVANFTVDSLNELLQGYASCATLKLVEILDARLFTHEDHLLENHFIRDYTIIFRTKPGDALFEATIRQSIYKKSYTFAMTGTISRINLYGQQSSCVTDFHLKLYCYCRRFL